MWRIGVDCIACRKRMVGQMDLAGQAQEPGPRSGDASGLVGARLPFARGGMRAARVVSVVEVEGEVSSRNGGDDEKSE